MTINLSVTIIEDDLNQAKLLADTLEKIIFSHVSVSLNVNISQNYIQIFNEDMPMIKKNEIFLIDIHLNTYFSGIDFAKHIQNTEPNIFIIYITSDPNKSIEAINEHTNPFSYILKDSQFEDLHTQLEISLNKIINKFIDDLGQKEIVCFSHNSDKIYVNPSKILYVQTAEGFQKKTILRGDMGEYLLNYRLIDVKKLLPDVYFQKNLRSVIVNLSRINKLNRTEGIVTFDDQSELYVGAKVIDKIKKAFI
ncbi:LytTR family transcriptional regulator DNA-binding domain-containing protein [Enterococcus casseliflavus]|nr:LytTR family transcriptional regulator DNA-binding domain-containing protein [Enterococcus casseliflavus]